MKIIKPGVLPKSWLFTEHHTCRECGAIFQVEPNDTYEVLAGPPDKPAWIKVACPTCHRDMWLWDPQYEPYKKSLPEPIIVPMPYPVWPQPYYPYNPPWWPITTTYQSASTNIKPTNDGFILNASNGPSPISGLLVEASPTN
jgi:hypothetical protein